MPETFRSYQTWEVALFVVDNSPLASGHERVQEGDIAAIRLPLPHIGTKERFKFLWVRLSGEDDNIMSDLAQPNTEPADTLNENGTFQRGANVFEKRRFCIPFERLNDVSAFDLARARDTADSYQPFQPIDEDMPIDGGEGLRLGSSRGPLDIRGLVFDKSTGMYL